MARGALAKAGGLAALLRAVGLGGARAGRDGMGRRLGVSRGVDAGARGERIAARYLKRHGYRVIERNARVGGAKRSGAEIDLVCAAPDRKTLVLVEVKTRRVTPGSPASERRPEAALTAAKRRKLLSAARAYAREHGHTGRPVRIDLVAVDLSDGQGTAAGGERPLDIRHYEAAVGES